MIKKPKNEAEIKAAKIVKKPVEKVIYAKTDLPANKGPAPEKKVLKSLKLENKVTTAEGVQRRKQKKTTKS
ncbi:hypothetical protein PHSC3_001385 [Chlamydiales bacterium STE3]|nr:hypothetical protein PHSC3_001385 [Chlamydiales bacterium STE3]